MVAHTWTTRHEPKLTPLIEAERIGEAVARLGTEIRGVYGDEELTVVSVLHGAMVFTADLIRQLDMSVQLATVSASSYHGASTTSGDLSIQVECADHLRDRHVLLVDDILDTGRTLSRLRDEIGGFARSLRIATLLDKPSRRLVPLQADFVGFEIPDHFVVGYGLDYDGRYRNLPDVMVLSLGDD